MKSESKNELLTSAADNRRNEDRQKSRILRGMLSCSLVLLLSTFAFGQSDATNVRFTTGETNDSANLSLTVPLGSYKGRGISLPINLTYSSASLWKIERLADVRNYNISPPYYVKQTITQAIFSQYSTAGWKSSLELPVVEWPKSDDYYRYHTGAPTNSSTCAYRIPRVFIHMPDGSTHEFREDDDAFQASYGVLTSGTFYAVDGSRMRYDSTDGDTGTLYLPDGTRYELDAGNGTIIDPNGNTATYSSSSNQWTDTLGRTLQNPIPANPTANSTTTVHLPGLSGVSPSGYQTYLLKWKYLSDVLTPVGGSTPALNYVASDYLPYPGSAPTASNDVNFPQPRPTASPVLFQSATNVDVDGNPSLAPTVALGKDQGQTDQFNPVVLSEIDLPDGTKYTFTYNVYGEITKIVYPTNAYELYEYERAADNFEGITKEPYDQAHRRLKSRKLSADGSGGDEVEWKYTDSASGSRRVTSIIAPDKTRTEIITIDWNASLAVLGYQDATNGSVVEKRQFSTSSTGYGGGMVRRELTKYDQTTHSFTYHSACNSTNYTATASANRNPRPVKKVSILFEGSGSALAQTTTYSYDTTYAMSTGVDRTQQNVYNFAVISNTSTSDTAQAGAIDDVSTGSLAKYTVTTYQNGSSYRDRNILGLPTQVTTYDASDNPKAKSQISYDDSSHTETSSGTLPTAAQYSWTDPTSAFGYTRGWPTIIKNYYDVTNSQYIQTENFYDQFGNLRKAIDGRTNETTTAYDDDYAFAFPTSITTPAPDSTGTYGSNSGLTTSTTYDYQTGLPLIVTDPNSLETRYEYTDDLLRPTKVYNYSGGSQVGGATETHYGAGNSESSRWVQNRSQIDSSNWKEVYKYYDGIGRTVYTQVVDDNADDIFVATCYDNMGRISKSSNPVRSSSAPSCSSSLDWTTPVYDDLGRVTSTTTNTDSGVVNNTYSLATSGSQIGAVIQVADQAGKLRRSITNASGQLIRVDEPNSSNQLGSSSSPNQDTVYSYDTLNNLTTVMQGSQTRSFVYDSLSRLTQATSPESGTVKYTYDANNNLKTKWDSRGIKIIYDYDTLNRVWKRCYKSIGTSSLGYTSCATASANGETAEANTPDVTMYYDNLTNAKGRLVKTASTVSTTDFTSFDILGRATASKQTTDGVTYGNGSTDSSMTYSYNLAGALIEQQYPSGRIVKNVLDNSGDLSLVESKKDANSGYWSYASSLTYNAAGAVTSMQLGNGRWESTSFNSRLQPTQIGLGTVINGTDKLKLQYSYGDWNGGSIDATKNNGNVIKQIITVPNSPGNSDAFTATQKYYYDSLNRIDDATEEVSGQTWRQDFSYDRYGNRNFVEGNTTTIPRSCGSSPTFTICTADHKKYNPSINTSNNNRIDTSEGYSFDSSGNATGDSGSNTFVYDGENKQVEAKNSGNYTIGRYYYDGDGKRVKKIAYNSTGMEIETTVFVYDANGKQIAEYSDVVANSSDARVAYLTSDNLGSPRINTDASGNVSSRHDYHPFGGEVQRTTHMEYSGDAVRKKFAGYERDSETQLDYLGARNYSYTNGRFFQVDPVLQSSIADQPQSWNRYSYTMNNPIAWIDIDGLWTWGDGATDLYKEKFRKWFSDLKKARDGYKQGSNEYKKLDKILNTLGTENDKNNVQIRFGTKDVDGNAFKEGETAATETVSRTREGDGVKAQYAITFNTNLLADNNYGTLAHEGQHVVQRTAFNDSLKWVGGRWTWSSSLDLTSNQRENDAFHATQIAAAGRREDFKSTDDQGNDYYLYRKSWGRVDNAAMRSTRAEWSSEFSKAPGSKFSAFNNEIKQNR